MHNYCHVLLLAVAVATLVYMKNRNERVSVVVQGQAHQMLFAPRHRYGIIGFAGLLLAYSALLGWSFLEPASLLTLRQQSSGIVQLIAGTLSTTFIPLIQRPSPVRKHAGAIFASGAGYGTVLFLACS